ncbi:hypothetical protein MLD38_028131 [Melastoma candidum]|uniref:Uncharacterized protein n=1 Tax=Melastoma candidum TaxID=119954 RepID=A0ACB9MZZ2_9MYRT|nr:hypothetical protein MLD38_028131 [Melastoma candidum]
MEVEGKSEECSSNGMNELRDSGKMQGILGIYRDDVVVRNDNKGLLGVVTEVAGDSDSDISLSDDEDDSDDNHNADIAGNHGNKDSDADACVSSVENSPTDEDVETSGHHRLSAEQVRVLWLDDREGTENFSDVTVVDRGFLPGDYVAAASDPTGQIGIVMDVQISVDLLAEDGSVKRHVSTKELKRVREFCVGDFVVSGHWLGRVDDVLDNVTVQFDDGSICKVIKAETRQLKPLTKNLMEDGNFYYYPGQRVKATSSTIFKNSRWLSGLWKATKLVGTVTNVTVGSAFVYWIASAGCGADSSTAPAEEQSPKNLKLLSCFSHANWQLGDWCLLPSTKDGSDGVNPVGLCRDHVKSGSDSSPARNPSESAESVFDDVNDPSDVRVGCNGSSESSSCSSSLSPAKPSNEFWSLHRKKMRKVIFRREKKNRKKEENFEKALQIVNTLTTVDILWQDGKIESRVCSVDLVPIETPGDHEFVAEQYVVEKSTDDEESNVEGRRVGVLKSVNAKERTACVNWLKPVVRAEDLREFDKAEIVSVYELEGHPDYDYCYGDVVVRLSPVSSLRTDGAGNCVDKSSLQNIPNDGSTDGSTDDDNHSSGIAQEENPSASFTDLSWVGNITSLRNGDIEVTWADGMVSLVGPQAIYVVGRDDDGDTVAGSEISDVASWETVDDDNDVDNMDGIEEDMVQDEQDGSNLNSPGSLENQSARSSALSLPLAAIGFVTRLASGIFSRGRRSGDSSSDFEGEEDNQSEVLAEMIKENNSCDECYSPASGNIENCDAEITHTSCDEPVSVTAHDTSNIAGSLCTTRSQEVTSHEETTCSFKHFDTARDPVDHYFLGTNSQCTNGRKWLKKVQEDWNILQNNLPDDIYVRVYEDRIDLLRAVIVGAYGTPYQDGLFFFDFHIPPEYPNVPPVAYYHSGGWRINPNLYEEGKVCLSLLNTWTGRGNEVWDPSSSSILQVLVSLQGLVLNSRPYFNEAGYDKQVGTAEGEKNSLSYNENTFLLNCKTMMNLIRRPPKDFDVLVKEHFTRRGCYILKACDAYMKGYLIGSLDKGATVKDEESANSTSVGFKLMLAKIVPKLIPALEAAGADCQEFQHLRE